MRDESVDAKDLQKLETRLEKQFREDAEAITARIKKDYDRWIRVVKEANIKVE